MHVKIHEALKLLIEYVFEKMSQGKEAYFENYEIAAERHFAYSIDNGRDDCGGTGPDVDVMRMFW